MVRRFRTKTVEIEAVQFLGNNFEEIARWTDGYFRPAERHEGQTELINGQLVTAEVFDELHATWIGVLPGQWIVCGAKGEYYPCDDETFHWKYEEV